MEKVYNWLQKILFEKRHKLLRLQLEKAEVEKKLRQLKQENSSNKAK